MTINAKTFRLFISSPFRDFKKEREVLHKKVFPRIDEYCKKPEIGFSFQPIDLRWGVSNEAQLDQKTLEVCLEEVRACKHFPHPNFLIMTGDRYGYIPLPYMIEEKEFNAIKKYLIEIKFVANEVQEIIEYWYHLDQNQIPSSYVLTRREDQSSNTKISKHLRQDYVTLNAPEDKKIKEWNKAWGDHESLMLKLFQEAVEVIVDDPNNQVFKDRNDKEYQKYFTSATEAEVIEGIIDYKDITSTQENLLKEQIAKDTKVDKEYVFGFVRTINHPSSEYVDWNEKFRPKAKEFKENLVNTLGDKKKKIDYTKSYDESGNILSHFSSVEEYEKKENELKEFEEFIYKKLKEAIDKQAKQQNDITPLEQEILEQQKFQQDKLKGFHGKDKTLSFIDSYISKHYIGKPLIIHGPSGMGKSSLMAAAIESRIICDIETKKRESRDDTDIVYRFVGATEHSTTIKKLLISIADELQDRKLIDKIEKYEDDNNKFYKQIKENFLSIDKPIVIFIDALDQLEHKEFLNWLPNKLPLNLKIILTVLNDEKYEEDTHYYNLLTERYGDTEFKDITDDSFLENEKKALIKDLLEIESRMLNEDQRKYLLKQWESAEYSPLYLKIATEEVKHWRSNDWTEDDEPTENQQKIGKLQTLKDNVQDVIEEYIYNLTKIYHIEKLMVDKVLGYIYVSKDGLSEKELLDILSEDLDDNKEFQKVIFNEFHEPITKRNPRRENKEECTFPISIWSRIHTLMKPFLIERNIDNQTLMKFFHRQFTSVIGDRYKKDEEKLHEKLVDFYRRESFDMMVVEDCVKIKLKNFMYHLFFLQEYEKLELLMIMFSEKIENKLYFDDFNILTNIYSFDSDVPEVQKVQGLKLILESCFEKENGKYRKKDFESIVLNSDKLEAYGIYDFSMAFKNMVHQVGLQKFILTESQKANIDETVWLKNYTLKDNYVNLHMALIEDDYINFDLEKVLNEDHICDNCNCVRREEQLIDNTCIKCLIEEKRYEEVKKWLEEKKYYIDDDEYKEFYYSDFEKWKNDNQQSAQDEFDDLDHEPPMTWPVYIADNTSEEDYANAFYYELEDYIKNYEGLEEFNNLEEYGFNNE